MSKPEPLPLRQALGWRSGLALWVGSLTELQRGQTGVLQIGRKSLYRLRQFWLGLQADVTRDELKQAADILPPAAFLLFSRLPVDGQRHSLNVLESLQTQTETVLPLAAAALLHDVGKVAATDAGVAITLWWRGPLVLLESFAPSLLNHLASPDPKSHWRYLFYVHQEHPKIGAAWAAAAGCSPLTCWLIAHHQEKLVWGPQSEWEQLLARLQWADSRN